MLTSSAKRGWLADFMSVPLMVGGMVVTMTVIKEGNHGTHHGLFLLLLWGIPLLLIFSSVLAWLISGLLRTAGELWKGTMLILGSVILLSLVPRGEAMSIGRACLFAFMPGLALTVFLWILYPLRRKGRR